jgi:myo-inositol catabolism protein IolC
MKNLLILPFDHRSSFYKGILGVQGKKSLEDKKKVKELKEMIFEAFLKSANKYPNKKDEFGVLVDREHGSDILKQAKKQGFVTTMTTEKSGQKEFMFEYGNSFGKVLKMIGPNYSKILVRYNPQNKKVNQGQLKRIKMLSDWCQKNDIKLLFELLVPPTETDLQKYKSVENYDKKARPDYTVQAIKEITKKIHVDVWKLEGFSASGWKKVLKVMDKESKVVFLGRGLTDKKVREWLLSAVKFRQVIGFAVGRTIFNKSLQSYVSGEINKTQAINQISRKFSTYINLWLKNR